MDTNPTVNEASTKIALLNDAARENAVNYMTTRGVLSLNPALVSEIYIAVQEFKDFTQDNDPYSEHDFGLVEVAGNKVFWKIDYYDQSLGYWCDPLDPRCRRVVTIMLAEEY